MSDVDDTSRGDLGLSKLAPRAKIVMASCPAGPDVCLTIALIWREEAGAISERQSRALTSLCQMGQHISNIDQMLVPERQTAKANIEALESRVHETETFSSLLLHSIHQCYWLLDLDSRRVNRISENFETIWGAPMTILTHGGLSGFMTNVDPEDRDRILADFHNHLGERLDVEFRVVTQEGEKRWMWLRINPIQKSTGETHQLLFIATDVTDKKMEEERIRAKEAELVSRARALAVVDLASGVAHEINNPLTVIVGKCAELLRMIEKGQLDQAVVSETAERIQTTSIRISDIVKSLKALGRPNTTSVASSVSLERLAREVQDVASERFKVGGVRLEIETPPATMMADMNETLVSQLILNLVNNAYDAVQSFSEKWVKVEFSDDADSVYISVTDSGAGIPIKNRSRIFDPFFTTKPPGQGTGLGLSLATSIAAHHHGSIRLDTLSARTRFVFQLPKQSLVKMTGQN